MRIYVRDLSRAIEIKYWRTGTLRYNGEGDEIVDFGLRGKDVENHEGHRWDMPGS